MKKENLLALDIAKDLTIAQLNNSPSMSSCSNTGKTIGDIYEAIYNKLLTLISPDDPSEE